jgi:acetate kinase
MRVNMNILAVNCGSSSIKFRLFDIDRNVRLIAKGLAERIGQESASIYTVIEDRQEVRRELSLPDHRTAMHALHQTLVEGDSDLVGHVGRIDGVGHRIVHGGERFRNPVLITADVIDGIKEAARFAPLHCQPNIVGIAVAQELLPDIPHIAVFDTAAHQTIAPKAFLYGLPAELYEKYKIRKYGFHGINHSYVANEAAQILAQPLYDIKVITCHLGNGCSITAFEQGRSIDTSMGLTPLEGLIMGSRCGDLDPAVVLYLMDELGLTTSEVADVLNKRSGLLGLCGNNDMRDIIAMAEKRDKRSQVAIEVFVYRIQKYIGAYVAAMNGIDAVVFTGGIGEHSPFIRERVAANLEYLGAHIEPEKNDGNETVFSSDESRVTLMTIPANEEMVIAKQTYEILTGSVENNVQNTAIRSS